MQFHSNRVRDCGDSCEIERFRCRCQSHVWLSDVMVSERGRMETMTSVWPSFFFTCRSSLKNGIFIIKLFIPGLNFLYVSISR